MLFPACSRPRRLRKPCEPPPVVVREESSVVDPQSAHVSSFLASVRAIHDAGATEEGKRKRASDLQEHLAMSAQMRIPKTWCNLAWLGQICEHGIAQYVKG